MENKFKVVSIVGPTASGKTKLSVALAKMFDGEIISADSMQIYKGMDIATAKADDEEKAGIPHHLMDFLPPSSSYSVACFVRDASLLIKEISLRGRLPIIVGGTGLFVDSLLNNIQFSEEERNEETTKELWDIYYSKGLEPLLEELERIDYESFLRLAPQKNPKRIIRAIEYYRSSGRTITEQIALSKLEESPYCPVYIGVNFKDREKLYEKINLRVDEMLNKGLLDEAKKYLSMDLSSTSSMAIGYKELAPYFKGELTLDECVENLKRETRRYAKRQITWFKRNKQINWLYVDDYNSIDELISEAYTIIKEAIYG